MHQSEMLAQKIRSYSDWADTCRFEDISRMDLQYTYLMKTLYYYIKQYETTLSITIIVCLKNLVSLTPLIQDNFAWLRDDSRKFYLIVFLHKMLALSFRMAQKA